MPPRMTLWFPVWLLLAILVADAPAHAEDVVIGFDGLPDGTTVGTQYHSLGVDFQGGQYPLLATAYAAARSASNVLGINNPAGEFSYIRLIGTFTNPHHTFVQMWVEDAPAKDFTLTGFDLGHNKVAETTLHRGGQSGVYDAVSITTSGPVIATFEVTGPLVNSAFVDDLRFDDIGTLEGPDFGLLAPRTPVVQLEPGGPPVVTQVGVIRRAGSSGAISFGVGALPAGVSAVVTPNPATDAAGGTVQVAFQASAGASPVGVTHTQLTGTPSAAAGAYGAHAVTLGFTVLDSYDAEVIGIEVTQGIQQYDLPQRTSLDSVDPVSYNQPGRAGVPLALGATTKVRVFSDLRSPSKAGGLPTLAVTLNGYRDGQLLPGSPLQDESTSGLSPAVGPGTVTDDLRSGKQKGGASLFTLPASWTSGTLTLVARIDEIGSFFPLPGHDCCLGNNVFTLTDVAFTPTHGVSISPMALEVKDPQGLNLIRPEYLTDETRNLLPIGDHQFQCWGTLGYDGFIDITDIWNDNDKDVDATKRGSMVVARLHDRADDWNYLGQGDLVVGYYPGSDATNRVRSVTSNSVAAVQAFNRPLSAIAHEIGHLMGRNHASGACDADKEKSPFDEWLPDKKGYLQGVGFDRRTNQVLFPPRDGSAPNYYDFMGYCGQNSGGDPDKWISVPGWIDTIGRLAAGAPGVVPAQGAQPAQSRPRPLQAALPQLRVHGFVDADGSVILTKVAPGDPDRPIAPDPASPYHLVVKDANGVVLADAAMARESVHVDDDPAERTFLTAQVPDAGTRSVEIQKGGAVVVHRDRSAHAPEVAVTEVTPDVIRAGVRVTTAKWTATDADGDALTAKVDYSPDGGKTWKPLWFGPNAGMATVPASIIPSSAGGLVRVRVSDGYNLTTAVSQPFAAAGGPPRARILYPAPGLSVRAGSGLVLSGDGVDDQGKVIPDSGLTWYVGDSVVGTGQDITVPNLAAGTARIRLVATDALGRTQTQEVAVDVVP